MDVIDARQVFRAVVEELTHVRKEAMIEKQLVGEPGR
jgi:hypothetical protein